MKEKFYFSHDYAFSVQLVYVKICGFDLISSSPPLDNTKYAL